MSMCWRTPIRPRISQLWASGSTTPNRTDNDAQEPTDCAVPAACVWQRSGGGWAGVPDLQSTDGPQWKRTPSIAQRMAAAVHRRDQGALEPYRRPGGETD